MLLPGRLENKCPVDYERRFIIHKYMTAFIHSGQVDLQHRYRSLIDSTFFQHLYTRR